MKLIWIRRENASEMVLLVMIWGIFSLLTTRLILNILGYPSIGNQTWHVAHALWGGLLMSAGMIINLSFLGERIKKISAAVFGIGLGLFVDELGKYLSADNNYFFRPAIIFIYLFFVMLFALYRYLENRTHLDDNSVWLTTLDRIDEIDQKSLESEDKKSILTKLDQIIKNDEDENRKKAAISLRSWIEKMEVDKQVSFWEWVILKSKSIPFGSILRRKPVSAALGIYSAIWAVDKIRDLITFGVSQNWSGYNIDTSADWYLLVMKLISDLAVAILLLTGLYFLYRKKTERGLRYYQRGLLLNIFLASVFKFYFEQFSAVFGLAISILILSVISRYIFERTGKSGIM